MNLALQMLILEAWILCLDIDFANSDIFLKLDQFLNFVEWYDSILSILMILSDL